MDYVKTINKYQPFNAQELEDQKTMLAYAAHFPHNLLSRSNIFAHFTSSGFIMNKALDQVVLIHHNIRNAWAWTGGHMDGDTDFLFVAMKEAMEETGLKQIEPLTDQIISLDILPVFGHYKRGTYISAHQHLNLAYVLIADEDHPLLVKPDENTDVKWFPISHFTHKHFDASDVYLYNKIIQRARSIKG